MPQPGITVQVPAEPVSVQLWQVWLQALLQQTPWEPQTPVAHSVVEPQVAPGDFLVWQRWVVSQYAVAMQSLSDMQDVLQVVPSQTNLPQSIVLAA